jgi:hypothetical protein
MDETGHQTIGLCACFISEKRPAGKPAEVELPGSLFVTMLCLSGDCRTHFESLHTDASGVLFVSTQVTKPTKLTMCSRNR